MQKDSKKEKEEEDSTTVKIPETGGDFFSWLQASVLISISRTQRIQREQLKNNLKVCGG